MLSKLVDCINQERERNTYLQEQLKAVAKAIQGLDIEQPRECLFGRGECGYPIDDCYNCPCHEWSDFGFPRTQCEFK